MTIFQSDHGKLFKTIDTPYKAGDLHVAEFDFVLSADFTALTDILEIGTLPAHCKLAGATLVPAGTLTDVTADIGIMTGAAGDAADATRALTTALIFNDVVCDEGEQAATVAAVRAIAPSDKHRGIGVKLSADVTGAATKKLKLVITYHM